MTNEDFIENLIEEHIQWRITELALIKKIFLKLRTEDEKRFFLQSSIPTIYAIWEGFIKHSLKSLLKFLDTKNISSVDISRELLVWSLDEKIKNLGQSKDFKKQMKHSQILINQLKNDVKFSKIRIDVKSNLNDKVLIELSIKLGIFHIEDFFSEDELNGLFRLVDIRNRISHGEKNAIVLESLDDIQEYIVLISKLMDNWISLIDEFLVQEKYLIKQEK